MAVDQTIAAESAGNPHAKNPRSTATGLGQFIDSTWLETIKKHRPDLLQGRTREEVLALRTDGPLSKEMTRAYEVDNSGILSGSGHPVTPGTQYLAHFAGPTGAVGILGADPTAPVAGILSPRAIEANPFLRGMTAGDLRSWADKKTGSSWAPAAATAPMSLAGPPPAMPISSEQSANPSEASATQQPETTNPLASLMQQMATDQTTTKSPPPMLMPQLMRVDLRSAFAGNVPGRIARR